MRGFTQLRTLRCSWRTITGEEPEDDDVDEALPEGQFHTDETFTQNWLENLAHRLPASLETLHLEIEPDHSYEAYWEHFVRMIRESGTLLPNLKRVYVENIYQKPIDDLVEALKERGIVYNGSGHFNSESKYFGKLQAIVGGQGVL